MRCAGHITRIGNPEIRTYFGPETVKRNLSSHASILEKLVCEGVNRSLQDPMNTFCHEYFRFIKGNFWIR
jgi:hypothetical protein